jgi:hypothetical protein
MWIIVKQCRVQCDFQFIHPADAHFNFSSQNTHMKSFRMLQNQWYKMISELSCR